MQVKTAIVDVQLPPKSLFRCGCGRLYMRLCLMVLPNSCRLRIWLVDPRLSLFNPPLFRGTEPTLSRKRDSIPEKMQLLHREILKPTSLMQKRGLVVEAWGLCLESAWYYPGLSILVYITHSTYRPLPKTESTELLKLWSFVVLHFSSFHPC
jgi:hypothetical protein